MRPLDPDEREQFAPGVVIEAVTEGSPAQAAGIASGDVVVAIEGEPLLDALAVPGLVTSLAGRRARFDLIRDGARQTVFVELAAAAP
jgi:S1-C subfamily serine protease